MKLAIAKTTGLVFGIAGGLMIVQGEILLAIVFIIISIFSYTYHSFLNKKETP